MNANANANGWKDGLIKKMAQLYYGGNYYQRTFIEHCIEQLHNGIIS